MNSFKLHGLVAASHTPFKPDGSLALDEVKAQAEYLRQEGIKAVFITGSTGESSSLTFAERKELIREWSQVAPGLGLTLIAHVGSNCLHEARELAVFAEECKVDAISALSPSYYKPASVELLVECCEFVASAAPNLPFYYYDIPALTGVEFEMVEFLKLAESRIPNLAGIKYTNPDLEGYRKALAYAGDRFDLPWGVDEMMIDALKAGAKGAVGSTYNFLFPAFTQLIAAFEAGNEEKAVEIQAEAISMIEKAAANGYLGSCKLVMKELGVNLGPVRLPLPQAKSGVQEVIDYVLELRRKHQPADAQ